MKNMIIRKVSVLILSCMAFLLLAPLTTYAFSLSSFWFNSVETRLSGGVYTQDPSNVVVKITKDDNTVTQVTYSDKASLFEQGYDDNNNLYWGVNFSCVRPRHDRGVRG
jgi:hypothetical protein